MNIEEIKKIDDTKIREIRIKYWKIRHKVFIDEYNISDLEMLKLWKEYKELEEKEIQNYLKSK